MVKIVIDANVLKDRIEALAVIAAIKRRLVATVDRLHRA